ncbi:MAG: hypothetical protein ACJ0G4_02990 [Alphaproteobacteria bacterium]
MSDDQLDFNFSRQIDLQRNLNFKLLDKLIVDLFDKNKSELLIKHLKLLIIELFICWMESEHQFLSVSMSKRGYKSKSRYNPNRISSYLIKAIRCLNEEKMINLHPGFYDSKRKISRLTRIRAAGSLVGFFRKIKISNAQNFNHIGREFILIHSNGDLKEYKDTYETEEKRSVINYYNKLIYKTSFDIPSYDSNFLIRGDNRKIAISNFNSCNYSFEDFILSKGFITGCWWNRLDLKLLLEYKNQILINNENTSHLNLIDFLGDYLSLISNSNIVLPQKSFSKILCFDRICYLLIKSFRSKNKHAFIKSVLGEKKKICLNDYSNKEIINEINNHIFNNNNLTQILFKRFQVNWDGFISDIFFKLISKLINVKIPIYLVKDKIFYPTSMESIILEKMEEILLKNLKKSSIKLNCIKSVDFNFEKPSFFGRLRGMKNNISKRYINNIKYFGLS